MFFQRKNSKKVSSKDSDNSLKKDKESHRKSDLLGRAKEGINALPGNLRSAKNDTEEKAAKLQKDVKAGNETILHKGSHVLEKAKEEMGDHAETANLKKPEDIPNFVEEAFGAVMENVGKNSEAIEQKVKGEIMSLAEAFHSGKQESEGTEAETSHAKAKQAEATEEVTGGVTEGNAPADAGIVERAVEEIQAVAAAVRQAATTETAAATETTAAAAETAEGGEAAEEAEETPQKRIDLWGFLGMLLERCCSPAAKD